MAGSFLALFVIKKLMQDTNSCNKSAAASVAHRLHHLRWAFHFLKKKPAMREIRIPIPEIGFIAGTREALGIGIGLLLADRLSREQRRAAGMALVAIGGLTTLPILADIWGGGNAPRAEHAPHEEGRSASVSVAMIRADDAMSGRAFCRVLFSCGGHRPAGDGTRSVPATYGLSTILPASVPAFWSVFSSCSLWAAAASSQRQHAADVGFELAVGQPMVDVVGTGPLLARRWL